MSDERQIDLDIALPVLPIEQTTRPVIHADRPEYPLTFAAFPIFAPVSDRTKLDTKNWGSKTENAHSFEWGTIQRFGPGLNIFDEDTIIALFQLARQHKHEGLPTLFPIPESGTGRAVAFSGVTSAYEVNKYLGRSVGGKSLEETWQSIQRLSMVNLTVETKDFDYDQVRLFRLRAKDPSSDRGRILVQFSPEVSVMLSRLVALDVGLRMSLTDTGKAVYRYILTLEAGTIEAGLSFMAEIVGFTGRLTDFKNLCMGKSGRVGIFSRLKDAGVISGFDLRGRGAKAVFILEVS